MGTVRLPTILVLTIDDSVSARRGRSVSAWCLCSSRAPTAPGSTTATARVATWAPEFGGRNGFPPPEKNELVLSIEMGCADTVPFQPNPNTPF